tara:strand:+ start:88 stop:1989 length:1902 start_codon:yes stop_codon:yes gene_type:complete
MSFECLFTVLARGLVCVSLVVTLTARADEPVRPYPDPGYYRMGVYAGGPGEYFDYNLAKMSLGDTFPKKRQWWASLKQANPAARRHDVYTVYVGVRGGQDFETCRRRLDAWLQPEPDAPTYPELLPAICLEEENVVSRTKLLDRLARYVRGKYKVPVFQWYSDPFGPNPSLTADGWIWDSYGWSPEHFRRHVMRFVATGKPVICVPWASDPHWPQWTQYPTAAELINREWHQFRTCLEFNVSTAPFCVAGPGAVNPWLSSSSPDMRVLRDALRSKRREMRALRPGDLPLVTANFSAAARAIPVGGDPDEPSRYVEDFSGFQWIDDATMTGFLDLKLASRPAEPGRLIVRPHSLDGRSAGHRAVEATMTYHLHSYFPLKRVRAELRASAPRGLAARTEISLTRDELGRNQSLTRQLVNSDDVQSLVLEAGPAELDGTRDVYVRIRVQQGKGHPQSLDHVLDHLQFECVHEAPEAGSAIKLAADGYGRLSYEDDFSTPRWRHFGKATASVETHGGFRGSEFWVGLKGGFIVSTTVVQRVSAMRPLQALTVIADCYANSADLGGVVILNISPRGGKSKWSARTGTRHNGPLKLTVPPDELRGIREFDVTIQLLSSSGVENGDRACATFGGLKIRGR